MKLRDKIHIVLFLIMLVVLTIYLLHRFNIRIPSPAISGQYCGDQICQSNENQSSCCIDCGCLSSQICLNNKCQVTTTTTSVLTGTTQKTDSQSGGESSSGESSSSSDGIQTIETTTTTLFMGCSKNNCEVCENSTVCYNVGCVWCKVSNRCLIICKG